MKYEFQPDDRVLVLDAADYGAARLREWAQLLTRGMMVGLGDADAIRTARRELADCENVMFIQGSRDGIPWRDGFFSVVVDAAGGPPPDEVRRVLHPSGRIYSIQP